MKLKIKKSLLSGRIKAPSSKSHTIRSTVLGSLAHGKTIINKPLQSMDCLASIEACKKIGSNIVLENNKMIIEGTGGNLVVPNGIIDVGNSGTTLRILTGVCSLINGRSVLTGDSSIRNRPMRPLLDSLTNLGANCTQENGNSSIIINGKIKGGITEISGITSQFTTSLLICTPLAEQDSIIRPICLREKPYVDMTLNHLKRAGVNVYSNGNYDEFVVSGSQHYKPFKIDIPGDFSSAAIILAAAAVTNSRVTVEGLDMDDCQADKRIIKILQDMGTNISVNGMDVTVDGSELNGIEIDLSDNPDLLPILAVVGSCAKGTTVLSNVEHARIKETDRITVMANELRKMGAYIKEKKDGLIIKHSKLNGTAVHGYNDHRIVMSLAVAGLVTSRETIIDTAEAVKVTYPNFLENLQKLDANIFSEVIK